MRILVECTHVFDNPFMNTGIQRVVKNIISQLKDVESEIDCIPVILKNNKVYEVIHIEPPEKMDLIPLCRERLEKGKRRYWAMHLGLERRWQLSRWPVLQKLLLKGVTVAGLWYMVPKAILMLLSYYIVSNERALEFTVNSDDTLLLLDSSWNGDGAPIVERLKQEGISIVSVFYDLIPITHPQFCDANLVRTYKAWFAWVQGIADGFVAISETIRDELKGTLEVSMGKAGVDKLFFDYFYLGCELSGANEENEISSKVLSLYSVDESVYLMVGTIEPRKNHHHLLDVFDELWAKGEKFRLCFVGGVGWKCQDLIDRVEHHEYLNDRLYMFNDLGDTNLAYCYKHARALIFPSFVEGFGLPLVEAMQWGAPVMASDIPVLERYVRNMRHTLTCQILLV
ncbi:MAG: glycosyltransferase family 4 protein [Pseudomonadales bacterium]|nr:glycosyltransferase family 4 protein [Pseudomonadales bacterium]